MPAPWAKGDASRRRLPNSGRAPDGDALRSPGPSCRHPVFAAYQPRSTNEGRVATVTAVARPEFVARSEAPPASRAGCRDRQTHQSRESRPVNPRCPSAAALFHTAIRVPKLPESEQNLAWRLLTSFPRGSNDAAFSSRGGRPRSAVSRKSDGSEPFQPKKRVTNCKNKTSAPMSRGNMATRPCCRGRSAPGLSDPLPSPEWILSPRRVS